MARIHEATLPETVIQAAGKYRRYSIHRNLNDQNLNVRFYLNSGLTLLKVKSLVKRSQWVAALAEFRIRKTTASAMMRLAIHYGGDAEAVFQAGGINTALEALREAKPGLVAIEDEQSKTPKATTHSVSTTIPLTPDQLSRLQSIARSKNMALASWGREVLLTEAIKSLGV